DGAPPPPVLQPVADFRLLDQRGEAFGSAELAGHVWVANFVFTTCPSVCPMLTQQMANLDRRFQADALEVRLVSFSVDPGHDTPEVLAAYAARHGADATRWRFLTGPPDEVKAAIEGGLRMRMGEREAPGGDIPHGMHFVLVDAEGRLRGFYRSDGDGLAKLERDVGTLLGG
ncbi:MAG: SCO family protein, partial [Myxococcota bacterium]